MKFDVFDEKMRRYEQSLDQIIPADTYLIARLDGHGFTRLTKRELDLKKPFDEKFRNAVVNTIKYLMTKSPFQIVYAFNESDEISLLFSKTADKFNRKTRKYNSLLAAETSVKFSSEIGRSAVFDCRIIALPSLELAEDYFLWRQEDARRNCLNAHCYYKLLSEGKSPKEAQAEIKSGALADRPKMLELFGLKKSMIPAWQLYSCGVYFAKAEKEGYNPITKEKVIVERKRLTVDFDLPRGAEYKKLIRSFLE